MQPDIDRLVLLHLATLCGEPVEALDLDMPMAAFDLDSFDAVELSLAIEKAHAIEIDPEVFLGHGQSLGSLLDMLRSFRFRGERGQ
ncbi:Acyl carrier protein [Rhodovastum atsumiense]|uniref:Acyl carrier protein n=1 Tax=Rhodovastum atsumiense TaxID=504468 RepID=A0A5M6ITU3_9PROT|nr:acyl carrier protein [Rhodovastum atsumiense]KAA5610855.1 acyl carrier protein [Rhodovastum atsumiense]CAH2602090.1 Acyl carrier protein [Rhodovastum atsumiense]